MSKRNRVTTITELSSGGFIRETSTQIRGSHTIEVFDLLDPYPDAYKVFMKRVTVKTRGKPKETEQKEWMIARPMDGHIPKGGYDIIGEQETIHYDLFAHAKHDLEALAEGFILTVIMKEPFKR